MSQPLFDLTGKTALLTGSSSGLGFAMARGLAEAGARVILNGRNKEKLHLAVEGLNEKGLDVRGAAFDITDETAVEQNIGGMTQSGDPVDILVNCAGIIRRQNLEEFDLSDWQKVIEINLTGVFTVSKHVAKGMIQRKAGKIINICSLMSEVGRNTTGAYAASKGGVKMLTRAMAVEWAEHNIQVNGIGPGYFLTELTQPLSEDQSFDTWLKNRTPANRWGKPEELIGTAIYLASEASDFVNGQIIYVDGGILASL